MDCGIFKVCNYPAQNNKKDIVEGVKKFKNEIMDRYDFDFAVIEDQPLVKNGPNVTLANFGLQIMDMCLRGIFEGMGKNVYAIHPYSMRKHYDICKGNNPDNKKESVKIFEWNKVETNGELSISKSKLNHIADSYLLASYFFEKKISKTQELKIKVKPLLKINESSIESSWSKGKGR